MAETYTSYFIEPYMEWFLNSTDSPVVFGEASALMCLSTVVLGKRWLTGADHINPNLYMMLLGPSSRARKSTAIKRAKDVVEQVTPQRIGPTDYTIEGLYRWMQEKDEETNKGRTRLTLFASEFAADMARMNAYAGPGFRTDLTNLYDGGAIEKQRAGFGKNVSILAPRVSLFGACTYENMKEHTKVGDWRAGFWVRFLYVTPVAWREVRVLPAEEDPMRKQVAVNALGQLWNALNNSPPGGLRLSPEATNLYAETYMAHMRKMKEEKRTDENHEDAQEVYMQRFWPNVRKLALLYQMDEDPFLDIGLVAMERAITFAANCWQGYKMAHHETTVNEFGTLVEMLLDALDKAGTMGIPISKMPSLFGHSRTLTDALKYCEATNLVDKRIDPTTKSVWYTAR